MRTVFPSLATKFAKILEDDEDRIWRFTMFVLTVGSLVALVAVFLFAFFGVNLMHNDRLATNRKLALKRAQKLGNIFSMNTVGGVTGICRRDDLLKAYEDYKKSVEEKKHQKWERVRLKVSPTFTFYQKMCDQNLMQIGSTDQLKKIMVPIIEKILRFTLIELTGTNKIPKNGKIYEEMRQIQETLLDRNEQLFVPFAIGKPSSEDLEIYKEVYTIENMMDNFLMGLTRKY